MGLISNTRGVFFTASAILILILLVTYVNTFYYTQSTLSTSSHTSRLTAINQFVENVERDSAVAVYTVGFRVLVALVQLVQDTGLFIDSIDAIDYELFMNGTANGINATILQNNSFSDWLSRIDTKANQLGVVFTYSVDEVSVSQNDPWNVDFTVNFSLTFFDPVTSAVWNFSVEKFASVPIDGFSDPIFIVGTGNSLARTINRTNYAGNFVSGSDPTNLLDHIDLGSYMAFSQAPNYLMRLEGNLSASPTGIESLVDKDALSFIMPIDQLKTSVDYLYFSLQNVSSYKFSIMPASFALDNQSNASVSRIQLYQLTGFVT